MQKAARVIQAIEDASSYNYKQLLLKTFEFTEGLKPILKFIYNPFHKTGISKTKLKKVMGIADSIPYTNEPVTYKDMIDYFGANQTGTEADLLKAAHFINTTRNQFQNDAYTLKIAQAIITQDLQIGVSAKTLNTVYGKKFIPRIECMLGRNIDDLSKSGISWPCIVTEKLDGVRRILIKENGICRFYSRSGHEDTGLIEIIEDAKHLPDNRVYDGELLAAGNFQDSIAQRQATNSIGNSKGNKTGLVYHVFDMLDLHDFWADSMLKEALYRKIILGATFMDKSIRFLCNEWPQLISYYGIGKKLTFIKPVPILGLVYSIDEVVPIVESIWDKGGEGVMLNTSTGLYKKSRSKELIKVKNVKEYVLKVVDIVEGTGKFKDMLGSLVVDYKGNKVGVGSGFTDEERTMIWANPSKYIGREVEIDSFGESTSMTGSVSLNCPTFKRFVKEHRS